MNRAILNHLLDNPHLLKNFDATIDRFSECKMMTPEELSDNKSVVYPGKLVATGNTVSVITEVTDNATYSMQVLTKDTETPFLSFFDKFTLTKDKCPILDREKITTTLGRYLVNYYLLVDPFDGRLVIPYINEEVDAGAIETRLSDLWFEDKVSIDEIKRYYNNGFFIENLNELGSPSITEDVITVDPRVIKLRDELMEKYKDQLDDPEVAVMIERELIALDRKTLAERKETAFLTTKKNFETHRKRMFLTMGILPAFGDETKSFNFAKTNLDEGWRKEDIATLFNDVRSGSYSRAKDTAKGGEASKFLERNFRESAIVQDDCGSKDGIEVVLDESMIDRSSPGNFLFRNAIVGSKLVTLTPDTAKKLLGKKMVIRSPMFCIAKGGYCFTCMDSRYKKIDLRRLSILTVSIGSAFLMSSMKKMHGSSVSTLKITTDVLNQSKID